jgi:very-short-patch-repair endonuclease
MNFIPVMTRILLLATPVALLSKNKSSRQGNGTDWNQRDKCESNAERKMFDALAHYNFHILTQLPIGKGDKADIFLTEYDLAIECDSALYGSYKEQLCERKKDTVIRTLGWEVLRVPDTEIYSDIEGVIKKVQHMINLKEQQNKTERKTKPKPATVHHFKHKQKRGRGVN